MSDILDKVITAAKGGDLGACKILLDKSLPAVKPVETARALPISGDTLTSKAASVVEATANGAISVDEATRLLQALGSVARIVESDDLISSKYSTSGGLHSQGWQHCLCATCLPEKDAENATASY